jgi:tetratricopeptide (TPR) repeat protein
MIVTEQFVFIHMHKTGGQTLNDIIQQSIAGHKVIGYHYPRAEVPPEAVELPVVGIVRNPWDWYVSWYAFNRRPKIRNQLFNVVSDSGNATFKETVTNLIQLGSDNPESKLFRDDLVRMLPESLDDNRGAGLTKESIQEIANDERGYYSWLFARMLGDQQNPQTFVGKFENLQDDFIGIMEQIAVKETETMRTALENRERKNVSHHSHYSHYYDDELRDLVASKEHALIEKYAYEFDSHKPAGVTYKFSADLYTGVNQGFQKLLGREDNYLQLHNAFDVESLQARIKEIPQDHWLESGREKLFAVHKHTHSLQLVHFEDYKYKKPEYRDLYFELQDQLQPLVDCIAAYYKNNGFIVRVVLAKLLAGGEIPHHTDSGFSLLNCHRVHIPIVTNEQVIFIVGGEEKNMKVGEFWEINNGTDHAVENRSEEDRIHMIIDWMPNYAGKSEEEVLAPDRPEGLQEAAAPEATVMAMVAQAHQLHQSGEAVRAESLYRQVLNLDAKHVIANNLLGLLCQQTKRHDEAVQYIQAALAEKPDDAQAHSNLGIVLNDLNRLEEASQHFHESLKLDPSNPRVYNNLGNIYVAMRRLNDAIKCY